MDQERQLEPAVVAVAPPPREQRGREASVAERADVLPLGAAALAGTTFPIDRHYVAVAALKALADEGAIKPAVVADAIAKYKIDAGRAAFEAGLMEMRDMAEPSTPVAGTPFFDLERKS